MSMNTDASKAILEQREIYKQLIAPLFQTVSPETLMFLVVITGFAILFHIRFNPSVANTAPAVLTTLGILGTFVGIALGLADFNVNEVQKSVPSLIDGIKTAVWASAWGIFCALSVKVREVLFGSGSHSAIQSGATIDDLADILDSLHMALVGGAQANLLTQMQQEHRENKELLEKLNLTLNTFCDKAVGGYSETMIDALKEVIHEFNSKVNVQFGSNFQQFSDEVKSSNEEHKNVMLGAIHAFNEDFNNNIQETVDKAKLQIATLEEAFSEQQAKLLEMHGKEFTALSQSLTRMVRQLHNDSMLTVK